MEPRQIATLSEIVDRAAIAGDKVAFDILTTAGSELAECAAAAVRRLGISGGQARVSYQGSVMTASEIVRESFCRAVSSAFEGVSVTAPRFQPVIGAYLLGRTAIALSNREEIFTALSDPVKV